MTGNVFNIDGTSFVAPRPEETAPDTVPDLEFGDGGGHGDGMNERVIRLEEWAKHADQRMGRVEDALGRIEQRLGSLPTVNGLWGMIATVIGVAVALVALVAGIFAYRQDALIAISDRAIQSTQQPAPAPHPIIIQVPTQQQAAPEQPPPKP